MSTLQHNLSEFLAEVVMTGHYLAEPTRKLDTVLHDAEVKCLKIINTLGPLQMHEIANHIHATKPRATQLVASLESHGLVHKEPGSDHRVKLVTVSNEGKDLIHETRQKYRQLAARIEAHLGRDQTTQLCTLLAQITPLTQLEATTIRKEQL